MGAILAIVVGVLLYFFAWRHIKADEAYKYGLRGVIIALPMVVAAAPAILKANGLEKGFDLLLDGAIGLLMLAFLLGCVAWAFRFGMKKQRKKRRT